MVNVANELKKINQRYKDLVNVFGIDSKPVQEYAQLMNSLPTVGTTSSGFKAIKNASFYTKKLPPSERKTIDHMKRDRYLDIIDQLTKMPTTSQYKIEYTRTLMWNEYQEQGIDMLRSDIDEYDVLQAIKEYNDKRYKVKDKSGKEKEVSAWEYVGSILKDLHDLIINNKDKIYASSQEITNQLRKPRGQNWLSLEQAKEVIKIVNGEQGTLQDRFEEKYQEPNQDYDSPEHRAWIDAMNEWIESDAKRDIYQELLIKYGSKLILP